MNKTRSLYAGKTIAVLLLTSLVLMTGCGGGGGGGSSGPANISVSADPEKIDAGDVMTVTVPISDVNEDGIMLKIRTPVGLDYVNDSGYLEVDGTSLNLDPDFYKTDTKFNYLVYFLSRNLFGESNAGVLTVKYLGTAAVAAGTVDVDADVDNPDLSDSAQFDVTNPQFTAEGSDKVVVKN